VRIDEGGSAPAPAGYEGISYAVQGLVAASNDGFTVDDVSGQKLINAIDELHDEVLTALRNVPYLGQVRPLGMTPGAQVYAPFLATVAGDPVQGAAPVLKKLRQDLEDAKAAIQKSLASYQHADTASGQTFNT